MEIPACDLYFNRDTTASFFDVFSTYFIVPSLVIWVCFFIVINIWYFWRRKICCKPKQSEEQQFSYSGYLLLYAFTSVIGSLANALFAFGGYAVSHIPTEAYWWVNIPYSALYAIQMAFTFISIAFGLASIFAVGCITSRNYDEYINGNLTIIIIALYSITTGWVFSVFNACDDPPYYPDRIVPMTINGIVGGYAITTAIVVDAVYIVLQYIKYLYKKALDNQNKYALMPDV
jgi:fumarate reductase subunit C